MARALVAVALSTAGLPVGADWPQWMGPERDGSIAGAGLFGDGDELSLEPLWKRPLGGGYSSVSVAGGRAFATGSSEEGDHLVAFDAASGGELWRLELDEPGIEKASSTPAIAGDRVFALNGRGKLVAVAAADGAPLWSRDLASTLGAVPPSYGMSTSPLLVDELVVVLVGGRDEHNLVAFEQQSGEIAWSVAHARRGSYASPVLLTLGGERQIVAPADDRLYAVRPADGSLLWSFDDLGYLDRIPLPLDGGRLFFAQETRATMLQVKRGEGGWKVEKLWQTVELQNSYSPAVVHRGAIFGFNDSSLTCLDAATGDVRWREPIGLGSLVLVDGHLLVLETVTGRLRVVEAHPDHYLERARIDAVAPQNAGAYASPSFAGGRIFVRGGEEIAALAVRR